LHENDSTAAAVMPTSSAKSGTPSPSSSVARTAFGPLVL
jgi:hypothetical protein